MERSRPGRTGRKPGLRLTLSISAMLMASLSIAADPLPLKSAAKNSEKKNSELTLHAASLTAPSGDTMKITGPASPTNSSSSLIVTWTVPSGASHYSLQVSRNSDCMSPAQSFPDVRGPNQVLQPLEDGNYYLCLEAFREDGSTLTASNNFYPLTVDTSPPGDFMIQNITSNDGMSFNVQWSAAEGAEKYTVLVSGSIRSDSGDCKDPILTYNAVSSTSQLIQLPENATGSYYVCVSAFDKAGNSSAPQNSPSDIWANLPTSTNSD